jgi:hypothetical protein
LGAWSDPSAAPNKEKNHMSLLGSIGKAIVDPGSLVTEQVDKLASKVGIPTQLSPGHLLHKTLTNGTESAMNKIGGGSAEKQSDGIEQPSGQAGQAGQFAKLETQHDRQDHLKTEQELRKHEAELRAELADIEARRHQTKVRTGAARSRGARRAQARPEARPRCPHLVRVPCASGLGLWT